MRSRAVVFIVDRRVYKNVLWEMLSSGDRSVCGIK